MGKLLNIWISAKTYNEDDVAKTWPHLVSLVWPKWFAKLGLKGIDENLPGLSVGELPVEASLGSKPHGVVELASGLPDLVYLGELPDNMAKALEEPVKDVERVNLALATALSEWDTKKATPLTFELEDALDKAEQSLEKIVG